MVSITFTPRPTKSNAKPMLVKGHVSPLSSFYRNIQLKMNRVEITTPKQLCVASNQSATGDLFATSDRSATSNLLYANETLEGQSPKTPTRHMPHFVAHPLDEVFKKIKLTPSTTPDAKMAPTRPPPLRRQSAGHGNTDNIRKAAPRRLFLVDEHAQSPKSAVTKKHRSRRDKDVVPFALPRRRGRPPKVRHLQSEGIDVYNFDLSQFEEAVDPDLQFAVAEGNRKIEESSMSRPPTPIDGASPVSSDLNWDISDFNIFVDNI